MSTERQAHSRDHCPLYGGEVCMDMCEPCRYNRGMMATEGQPWSVNCNWPRDGSFVSALPDRRIPVPDVFSRAFEEAPEPGGTP